MQKTKSWSITEQIEYQPSQFYRLQIIRPVYASRARAHAPIVAALPAQVIPQAGVGVGFVTHIIIAKYVDALPLYRQERIDARGGVWITRQARCRYVEAAAHLLITIHHHLKRKILDGGYVQVDSFFSVIRTHVVRLLAQRPARSSIQGADVSRRWHTTLSQHRCRTRTAYSQANAIPRLQS